MQMSHAHDNVKELVEVIHAAEAVVVGAGSGLSTAAGLTYNGERFRRYFSDFIEAQHKSKNNPKTWINNYKI